jgi:hypothetical protein
MIPRQISVATLPVSSVFCVHPFPKFMFYLYGVLTIGHCPDARLNTPHHFANNSMHFGPNELIEDDSSSYQCGETSCLLRFLCASVSKISVLYIWSTLQLVTVRTRRDSTRLTILSILINNSMVFVPIIFVLYMEYSLQSATTVRTSSRTTLVWHVNQICGPLHSLQVSSSALWCHSRHT